MRAVRWSLILAALVALGGCATISGISYTEEPVTEHHKQRLVQRATEFWKLMEQQGWDKSYEYFDPFMRAKLSRKGYVDSRVSQLHYSGTAVKQINSMQGRIADVAIDLTIEIIDLPVYPGKTKSAPPQQRQLVDRWLWIDGDWYRQYITHGDQSFAVF